METRKPLPNEDKTLLEKQEDHFFDFKSASSAPASLQTDFVAFANSDGGNIYIGIEDKKVLGERIRGFKSIEDANDVIRVLLEETSPAVENVDIEFIDFGLRGYVLHVSIPKSPKVHYTAKSECYIRINASSNKIKGERIIQLGYSKGAYYYERQPIEHVSIEDITDGDLLEDYMIRIQTQQDKAQFLRKQRLLTKKNNEFFPNAGCVLLFESNPQATLNSRCAIKVYRLRTTEAEYKREYLEGMPKTINGPVEAQIYSVINVVEEMLQDVSFREGDKIVRLRYPSEALKEILPNPVNHDIGEGLNTARNALKKAGLVDPEIKELENAVLVTIRHQRIATLEDIILGYLEEHEYVTNRIVRNLSGEDDVNKVKKAFQRLRASGLIEPEDETANVFDFRYRRKPGSKLPLDNGSSAEPAAG